MWIGFCTSDSLALRVVFDTNVFISALFGGFPEEAYQAALEMRRHLVASSAILAERARALREKFHTPEGEIGAYVKQIGRISEMVRPNQSVAVLRDEADNRVLEWAEAGRVDLIVSGDRGLLRLKHHGAVPIVRPADFVRTLGPPHSKYGDGSPRGRAGPRACLRGAS